MIKKTIYLIILFLLIITYSLFSAGGFTEYSIDMSFTSPSCLDVADINNDGYLDIIGSSWNNNLITLWYHNGDTAISWTRIDIENDFAKAAFVNSADINLDSSLEILGAAWGGNEIAYWKKTNDTLWIKYPISDSFTSAHEVCAGDVNGDELPDIIGASAGLNQISWWENQGGIPIQWNKHIICSTMTGVRSISIVDIDIDNDLDVVGAASENNNIRWWENDGLNPPGFTEHLIIDDFSGAHMVRSGDVNNDGYPDIVAVGWQIGKVVLWLNDGTSQVNWAKIIVDPAFSGAMGVGLDYLDSDSFIDIYATSLSGAGYLTWYKNNGLNPPDWEKQFIDLNLSGAWPLSSGDIDNDGKIDIISGANYSVNVNWYKNEIVTYINEYPNNEINTSILCSNYPNPFSEQTNIQFTLGFSSFVEVSIYDIAGNKITELLSENLMPGINSVCWNGVDKNSEKVRSGIYFYKIISDSLIYKVQDMILIR